MRKINNIEIAIIILISFIIGFSINGIIQFPKTIKTIEIPKIIEKNVIEKCQCSGLTTEDVELIIRQQFIPAFEFNYAVDGAIEEARLVPLIKKICK